jgi:ribosomal-protein-alanine N-acetyltransferase
MIVGIDLSPVLNGLSTTREDRDVAVISYPNGIHGPVFKQRPRAASMTRPDATWRTARLLAKPAHTDDAAALFDNYTSDPEVAKYLTWTPHRALDETHAFLQRCERVWTDQAAFPWTLWLAATGEFVGVVEIRVHDHAVDLGYALARRWWRHGLMTEAVSFLIQWAMSQASIYRVWATCDVDNVASARLLERVGMQHEGLLRRWLIHPNMSDTPRDCLCYAIVKSSTQKVEH